MGGGVVEEGRGDGLGYGAVGYGGSVDVYAVEEGAFVGGGGGIALGD